MATVKGEIDLEDDQGNERCVFNEQWPVADAVDAARAVRELADQVTTYPIDELLSMNWPPEIVDPEPARAGVPPGVTITTTRRIRRRDSDRDRWADDDN